jgi:hypothetical protein
LTTEYAILEKPERLRDVRGQATKGGRWMPWRQEAMKGVASCDKPRSAASRHYEPRMPEWGNPRGVMPSYPPLNP